MSRGSSCSRCAASSLEAVPLRKKAPSQTMLSAEDWGSERELYQRERLRNGDNALHNGRTDSAADFGGAHVHGSSGASTLAVSACDSEGSDLLSISEHGPRQAVNGHSLAEDQPDQECNLQRSGSTRAAGASSRLVPTDPEHQHRASGHTSIRPSDAGTSARSVDGSSGTLGLTEHEALVSDRQRESEQQEPEPDTQSARRLPDRSRRWKPLKVLRRSCKSVPWSQVRSSLSHAA